MITWYCPDCPYEFGSRSGIAVRDARLEHLAGHRAGIFMPKLGETHG